MRVLQPIWHAKPETASRVRMRIERVLGWAAVHGYRAGDNPARWHNHSTTSCRTKQDCAGPASPGAAYVEVPAFIREILERDGLAAEALEFPVLTAASTSEVFGATWREFDLKAGVWTIPPGRMKSAREHRVPLSPRAVDLLKGEPRAGERVFPLTNMAFLQLLKRMNRAGITPHGMRSSSRLGRRNP